MRTTRRVSIFALLALVLAVVASLGPALAICCDNPGPVEVICLGSGTVAAAWDAQTGELCGYVYIPNGGVCFE